MHQLKQLYIETLFLVYASCIIALCLALYAVVKWLQPLKLDLVSRCAEYEAALLQSPRNEQLIEDADLAIAELEIKYEPWEKLHRFAFCALSGCIGANSILFGKMVRAERMLKAQCAMSAS